MAVGDTQVMELTTMNSQNSILAIALAIVGIATQIGCGNARAVASEGPEGRQGVALVVYSSDFAMVREDRTVHLEEGHTALHLPQISKLLEPSSVLFSWPKGMEADVVANTYDLGVSGGNAMLGRYLGQEVELVWHGQDGSEGDRIKGTLQVADDGGIVVESNGKMLINPGGSIMVPKRDDIVTIPQLSVDVQSKESGDHQLKIAYLTRGLSWSADYTAILDPGSDSIKLECWATVRNQTGTSFPSAKLTLVAGAPNRAAVAAADKEFDSFAFARRARFEESAKMPLDSTLPTPEAMGELYSYPVEATSTIAQGQLNRVRMLNSTTVPVVKDYSIRINPYSYGYRQSNRQNAQLSISFKNSKEAGLGVPLPKGAVRAYEPDAASNPRYIGAGGIQDTPEGGSVNLTLSNAFDLTSEFRVVSTKRIDKKRFQTKYEVTLRNAKRIDVNLRVVHSVYGKVVTSSVPTVKLDSGTSQWTVKVPASGTAQLMYTVVTGN